MESKPVICVSICEDTLESLKQVWETAAACTDFIELRFDCLKPGELADRRAQLDALIQNSKLPVIVTYRPSEAEGRKIDLETRSTFWLSNPSGAFLDVEFELARSESFKSLDWSRTICSYHDFGGTPQPAELDELYQKMAATPARIIKIAAHANDVVDCLPLFHLLDQAQRDGRKLIAISMGRAGIATRILGPSRGSFLTYAAPDNQKATAPGQLSLRALKDVYRIHKINRQTAIYGLLGQPVTHSLSPAVHNAAFNGAHLNAVYIPFEVSDVAAFLRRMVHPKTREIDWDVRGLSVTAPHKTAVMDQLDWVDPVAREIGAVNTIQVDTQMLRGFNTDAQSFLQPLIARFGALKGLKCAVIGAGGAANAVVWGLTREGAVVTVLARNVTNAKALAAKYGATWGVPGDQGLAGFDVVVNATPLGTAGDLESATAATSEQLRDAGLAYDLVYNPTETRFLKEARAAGCETIGGLAMFVAQAAKQFSLWTGLEASESFMRVAAERALTRE